MKKIVLVIMICFISMGILIAQESSPLQKYQQDPTRDNFLKAYNFYYDSKDSEDSNNARLRLNYLLFMALNQNLKYFQSHLDSLNNGTKFQYANLLLEIGKYNQAIDVYDKLNAGIPKWSCPWRHKGEAYFKQGKLAKAETSLLKSIETRKEHYDAYIMLADVQNDMGKHEEALETFETGLSYKGKDIEDPEKEVDQLEEKFLYLELLQKNNKQEKYKELKEKLKKTAPDHKYWKK